MQLSKECTISSRLVQFIEDNCIVIFANIAAAVFYHEEDGGILVETIDVFTCQTESNLQRGTTGDMQRNV